MLAVSLKITSLTLTLNSKLNKEKIMYKYNVQVKKVSGRLNESVLPNKSLVVKSKTEKSDKEVFAEASKYYKEKYGLVIESADVVTDEYDMMLVDYDSVYNDAIRFVKKNSKKLSRMSELNGIQMIFSAICEKNGVKSDELDDAAFETIRDAAADAWDTIRSDTWYTI